MFDPDSRYHGLPIVTRRLPDGRVVRYVKRRFLPDPDTLTVVAEHTVRPGERLDHIAAANIGAPEMFWRICDAQRQLHPADLEVTGMRLRIPGVDLSRPVGGLLAGGDIAPVQEGDDD